MKPSPDIPSIIRRLRIVYAAWGVALVLFVGLGYWLSHAKSHSEPLAPGSAIPELLGLVAVLLVPLATGTKWGLRRHWQKSASPDSAPLLEQYYVAVVIAGSMRVAVGLTGFVITVLTRDPVWSVALTVLALVALGVDAPSRADCVSFCGAPDETSASSGPDGP